MVVDSEKILAEMISITMRDEGWRVSTAWDGASAIQTARNEPLDVVVLDPMLADMSALHLVTRLRELRPNLLLFLLSSNDSVDPWPATTAWRSQSICRNSLSECGGWCGELVWPSTTTPTPSSTI